MTATTKFIMFRERHYQKIRSALMLLCVLTMVYFFHFKLQPALEEINNDYNKDLIELIEYNNNNDLAVYDNLFGNLNISTTAEVEYKNYQLQHSPVVEAIWSVINIMMCLFILSLLWHDKEELIMNG